MTELVEEPEDKRADEPTPEPKEALAEELAKELAENLATELAKEPGDGRAKELTQELEDERVDVERLGGAGTRSFLTPSRSPRKCERRGPERQAQTEEERWRRLATAREK